jgi:hypothetical protein
MRDSAGRPAALFAAGAGPVRTLIAAAAVLAAAVFHSTLHASSHPSPLSRTHAYRYADGPPAGFSGGFKEDSCQACHFGADTNVVPGSVTIDGVPERFAAGERYRLTITLKRPGMAMGGFQLTARFAESGAQAGTLAPASDEDKRVRVEQQGDVQYAAQRLDGTALTEADTARWSIDWTAPEAKEPVVFHVSANAANKDDTAQGDYVYTASVESRPSAPGR